MADEGKSRRAIDFYSVERYARIDEQLKHLANEQGEIAKKTNDTYFAMFGGPGLENVGISETVRGLVQRWAIFAAVVGSTLGFIAGLCGYWIQKKFIDVANAPIFPSPVSEDTWSKMHAKKVLRFHNPETGRWEYYYELPGQPPPVSRPQSD